MKIGDEVRLTFLDHAECADDCMLFKVYGIIQDITKDSYILHSWTYVNEVDRAKDDNKKHNEHSFAIVKKAVTEIAIGKFRVVK